MKSIFSLIQHNAWHYCNEKYITGDNFMNLDNLKTLDS